MPAESFFGLTTFAEMCLSSLEDAVDSVAVDVPGLLKPIRKGRPMLVRIGELPGRIQTISDVMSTEGNLLEGLEKTFREIDLSSAPDQVLQLWQEMAAQFSKLEKTMDPSYQEPSDNFAASFNLFLDKTQPLPFQLRETSIIHEDSNKPTPATDSYFVQRVTAMCEKYRQAGIQLYHPNDRLALLRAYQLVEGGVRPGPDMEPIRTDEKRRFPTYLSLADPGPGHLRTTVRSKSLLKGTIVHIETIDRGGIPDRGTIEAYRIPSIRDVARIRVQVGSHTPCSVFVGRPVFEGWKPTDPATSGASVQAFHHSLLKAAHTVAAACSGLFSLGVAECKIGMDGLTASQALEYMKALTGNVIRDRFSQRLSAAFNINTPIFDDRDPTRPLEVAEPFKVAELGVLLAKMGNFEKVTWDGASNQTSEPIIGQLTPAQLFELVHKAHEKGLETYISAGMTADHMDPATKIGVGGVGIGTRLHESLPNGTITRLKPSAILDVLRTRDQAMKSTEGKAAALLAQLDWKFSPSKRLHGKLDQIRADLYDGLMACHLAETNSKKAEALGNLEKTLEEVSKHQLFGASDQDDEKGEAKPENPVIQAARAYLQNLIEEKKVEDAKKLQEMIINGDIEGLKLFMGK